MKKIALIFACLSVLAALSGCTRTVHCDGCGKELKISGRSNMTEDWIIFCKECEPDVVTPSR